MVNIYDYGNWVSAPVNAITVVPEPANHTPTVGEAEAGQTVNDNATVSAFTGFTIADADATQTQTVTVTLDTAAKGSLASTSGGSYNAATGVWSFSGTAADAQTAVQALVFTPTANRVAVGSTQ